MMRDTTMDSTRIEDLLFVPSIKPKRRMKRKELTILTAVLAVSANLQ